MHKRVVDRCRTGQRGQGGVPQCQLRPSPPPGGDARVHGPVLVDRELPAPALSTVTVERPNGRRTTYALCDVHTRQAEGYFSENDY